MQNNQNHQLSKCDFHSFSLKALQKERKSSLNACLRMCRAKQTKNKKIRDYCPNYQGPVLNRDKSHATPAFILPNEKIEYVQSARQILREHEKRVKQSEAEIEQLYIPRPLSKNMYCNVCRDNYKEYLDHIRSQGHLHNSRKSEFNRYILELQQKFKKQSNTDNVISSTESISREESEASVEIVGVSGRKMIKTESQQKFNSFCPFFNPSFNYAPFSANYDPFTFNQLPTSNSYQEILNFQHFLSAQYLPVAGFAPMNSFMQQNHVSYPQYFIAYESGYPINVFQQQV